MADEVKKIEVEVKSPTLDDVFDERAITEDASPSTYGGKKKKPMRRRKIVLNLKCPLCEGGVKEVSYKDVYQLKKFTSVRGKIIGTEKSGVCQRHQRQLTRAIKRARQMGLMPYVASE